MFLFLADLSTEQLVAQTLMVIVPSLHQNMCVELNIGNTNHPNGENKRHIFIWIENNEFWI